MKFVIDIKLGDEAMHTPYDVGEALCLVASHIKGLDGIDGQAGWPLEHSNISDSKGNLVGYWSIVND